MHPRSRTDSSVCVYESRGVVERTSFPPLSPSPSYMPTTTRLYFSASIRPFVPWALYMSLLFFFPHGPLRRLPPLLCHSPPVTHSRAFSLSLIVFIWCLSTRLISVNPRTFVCTSVDPSQGNRETTCRRAVVHYVIHSANCKGIDMVYFTCSRPLSVRVLQRANGLGIDVVDAVAVCA